MSMSRDDAIALHGMGKNMFKNVDAIQDSKSFGEMSAVMIRMSKEMLSKSDKAYKAKLASQLRICAFIENHNIK